MSKLSMDLSDLRPADPRRRRREHGQAADVRQQSSEGTADGAGFSGSAFEDAGTAALRREVEAIRAQLEYERHTSQAERVRGAAADDGSGRRAAEQAGREADAAALRDRERALAAERDHVESLREQLHEMTAALQAERNTLEVERQALDESRQLVESERRSLQVESERIAEQTRQARQDRESFEQALAQAADQRRKIDEAARALEARSAALEQQNRQVDANRDEIESQQQALAEALASLASQRSELDEQQGGFAARSEALSRRQEDLDRLASELASRQLEIGQRAAELRDQASRQEAELAKVSATTASARQAEVLADDAMEVLGPEPAEEATVGQTGAPVGGSADADLRDLLTDLPLERQAAGRTSPSTRHRILAPLVAALLVVGIVLLLVAPEWLGLGRAAVQPDWAPPDVGAVSDSAGGGVADAAADAAQEDVAIAEEAVIAEEVAIAEEAVAGEAGAEPVGEYGGEAVAEAGGEALPALSAEGDDGAMGEAGVSATGMDEVEVEVAATVAGVAGVAEAEAGGGEASAAASEGEALGVAEASAAGEMDTAAAEVETEVLEAGNPETVSKGVAAADAALAIPGGVWTYKAPEQLLAGGPSAKLAATRQWAVRELAESIAAVRERYRLLDGAGPRQVVALGFSAVLERELDRYLPPPIEFERSAAGELLRPAALIFAEFETPAGRYLLLTQALADDSDGGFRLVPGLPKAYVLVPGAIQEETVVLDGRRRAWPQPD